MKIPKHNDPAPLLPQQIPFFFSTFSFHRSHTVCLQVEHKSKTKFGSQINFYDNCIDTFFFWIGKQARERKREPKRQPKTLRGYYNKHLKAKTNRDKGENLLRTLKWIQPIKKLIKGRESTTINIVDQDQGNKQKSVSLFSVVPLPPKYSKRDKEVLSFKPLCIFFPTKDTCHPWNVSLTNHGRIKLFQKGKRVTPTTP